MTPEIRLETVPPRRIAVVVASASWAEFPRQWPSMLDKVWDFLSNASDGLHDGGHNVMLYRQDVPTVEVGVEVTPPFDAVNDVRA
jgi:hypothetical protein